MSTKDWTIRTIPLFLVLGLNFGWHEWSDHTYLELLFYGMLIALFGGEYLIQHLREEQRQNKLTLDRIAEEQRQNGLRLERLEEGQRRIEAEQQKLNRQQVRTLILIEGMVAATPTSFDSRQSGDLKP